MIFAGLCTFAQNGFLQTGQLVHLLDERLCSLVLNVTLTVLFGRHPTFMLLSELVDFSELSLCVVLGPDKTVLNFS
jgi:hypothetical protein